MESAEGLVRNAQDWIIDIFITRIPHRKNFTLIFIQAGDNVWRILLKFRVVFNILDSLLAIHLTYPNIRYGFSCSN